MSIQGIPTLKEAYILGASEACLALGVVNASGQSDSRSLADKKIDLLSK